MSTVLVVDDDTKLSGLVARKLGNFGFAVHTAGSVHEAFRRAKEVKPDILLLDVMLGDGLGYQTSRRFRKDPELYHTSIIFQSVLKDPPEVDHAMRQGGDTYLVKPYSVEGLRAKLDLAERLNKDVHRLDPVTGMPGLARMRREVDHLLMRGEHFALIYLRLCGVGHLQTRQKNPALQEVEAFLADLLRNVIKQSGFYETLASHIGGPHFMILAHLDDHERLPGCIREAFEQKRAELLSQIKLPLEQAVDVNLQIGVAHTKDETYTHAEAMIAGLRALSPDEYGRARQDATRRERNTLVPSGHEHWVDW